MIVKPAISFLRQDSDAQLIIDAQNILKAMTGNAAYPTPTPALATVTTALDDFTTALAAAADGGKKANIIKNQKRAVLTGLLRQLAIYVHLTCNNDLATLVSSGFPYQKPMPTPAGVLPAPNAPALSQGPRSGEMYAATTPVPNGYTYNWFVALASAPDTAVQQSQTTAASNTFDGLTPGQAYVVSVNVVGSAGPSEWSDTAQMMVV